MARSGMFHATVVGTLTRDPEMKEVGENSLCEINVAVNNKAGDAQFIRAAIWGKGGEALREFVKKGDQVAITGEVETRAYTNKQGEPKVGIDLKYASYTLLRNARGGGDGDVSFDTDALD